MPFSLIFFNAVAKDLPLALVANPALVPVNNPTAACERGSAPPCLAASVAISPAPPPTT